jgi:hypothetical protein
VNNLNPTRVRRSASHHLVLSAHALRTLRALFERPAHLFALQLLEILNQAVREERLAAHLAAGALALLHFADELPALSPNLLLLDLLSALLHALEFALVPILLVLLLPPLFVGNFRDDLLVLILALRLHVDLTFLLALKLLNLHFVLLLIEGHLEPHAESLHCFFALGLLVEVLLLLFVVGEALLFLLLVRFLHFPLEHHLLAALVLLVLLGLLHHQLFVGVPLRLVDQHLAQRLLVLFGADPLFVSYFLLVHFCVCDQCLVLFVDYASTLPVLVILRLVLLVCETNLMLLLVQVGCFVKAVQQLLVLTVLTFVLW